MNKSPFTPEQEERIREIVEEMIAESIKTLAPAVSDALRKGAEEDVEWLRDVGMSLFARVARDVEEVTSRPLPESAAL